MRITLSAASIAALSAVLVGTCDAFSVQTPFITRQAPTSLVSLASATEEAAPAMADSGVPPEHAETSEVAEEEIPTNLPSDVGMDYIPLATMLATGQLAEADQVRMLIGAYRVSCVQYLHESCLCISLFRMYSIHLPLRLSTCCLSLLATL